MFDHVLVVFLVERTLPLCSDSKRLYLDNVDASARGVPVASEIDVDGVQLMSKATCFRFASCSAQLSSGMERIRPAKDH